MKISWTPIKPLNAKQAIFYNPPTYFNIACCGTKFGKTFNAIQWLYGETLKTAGIHARWGAPIYKQAKNAARLLQLMKLPEPYSKFHKTDMILENMNGSILDFRSAEDPTSWEGDAIDRFVLDEFAKMDPDIWASHLTTVTNTKGFGWIISTPYYKGLFYDLFKRGLDPNQKYYSSFTFKTLDNPTNDPEIIAERKLSLPESQFRMYFEAEFIDDGSAVFGAYRKCMRGRYELPVEPVLFRRYFVAVDYGREEDFTVITAWDYSSLPVRMVHFERFTKQPWDYILERVAATSRKYNNAQVIADATGVGQPQSERLAKEHGIYVEEFTLNNYSKEKIVIELQIAFEAAALMMPMIKEIDDEVECYTYKKMGNFLRYTAPPGKHDDIVMNLCLVAHKASELTGSFSYSSPYVNENEYVDELGYNELVSSRRKRVF